MTETTTNVNTSNVNANTAVMAGESSDVKLDQPKRKRNSANKYKSYDEAQKFAMSLNLKSRKEWREYVKGIRQDVSSKPDDIPAHPDGIYKTKGWQGWRQWLGTEKPSTLN